MLTLDQHLYGPGPKRILSLDGGGVRGLFTLGILARLEDILAARYEAHYIASGKTRADFRLCDYFDLIGGTSTGGIIAAMLCLGMKVEDIRTAYLKMCPKVFEKGHRGMLDRFFNPYNVFAPGFDAAALEAAIRKVMSDVLVANNRRGHGEPLLNSDLLRTGLALVTKRIDTGSVWVLTNNKRAKFWHPDTPHHTHVFKNEYERFYPNGEFPLSLLVRATASAPFLLDAAELAIGPKEGIGVFLDGGASPFNNPAMELFLTATLKKYGADGQASYSPNGFDWEATDDALFVYSVGTGSWRTRMSGADYQVKKNWEKAKIALLSMIDDGMKTTLTWLQAMSEPTRAAVVDGNLGAMSDLRISPHKLLTFHRCNLTLETAEMAKYLPDENITDTIRDHTRLLDNAGDSNLQRLDKLGRNFAAKEVLDVDLPAHFDPYPASVTFKAA